MIRILIVEDMILLQESLASIINGQADMDVAGVSANADDALALCRELIPDLALIDVMTANKANGIAAAADIRREMPDVKVVIMTALPEITFIDAAKQAGAHSFIYKDSTSQHVLYVIRCTMQGMGIYPGPGNSALAKTRFSDAEIAVIRLVCQGKKLNEIGMALSMPEDSVTKLISGILDKTGFDSISKFSIYAVANGFIVPDDSMPTEQNIHAAGERALHDTQDAAITGPVDFLAANNGVQDDVNMTAFFEFKQNLKKLSRAEASVFDLYIAGYSAAEITGKLFVSANTIKSHNKNIFRKLNVSSLKELKVYAQMIKAAD